MFITFEGCEGVGKSTQLNFLKEYLNRTGQEAVFVREPGGTSIGEQIRKVILNPNNTEMAPVTESMLYASSRVQLIDQVILPALRAGKIVVCDRYLDSSIAYQGYARGLGADLVKKVNYYAVENCMPDVTIFLDLCPAESFRATPGNDRMEQENREFHNKVYEGYKAEIAISNGRIVPIKPSFDKNVTKNLIIDALRQRGAIK
ncbi:MAG: dTMP kinase [Clostridia bacterium]|nr:dTMP kinase [Clostridia bacterium]